MPINGESTGGFHGPILSPSIFEIKILVFDVVAFSSLTASMKGAGLFLFHFSYFFSILFVIFHCKGVLMLNIFSILSEVGIVPPFFAG